MYRIDRIVLLAVILLVTACSSTTIVGSWRDPQFNKNLQSIYIVGMSQDETGRRMFEDRFAEYLAGYGVKGIASYREFSDIKETDHEKLARQIESSRADAILISSIVGKRTEEVVTPGRITGYHYGPYYTRPGYYRPYPYYDSWQGYYDRSYEMVYEPPSVTKFEVVTIESVLYETGSGELIWSAQLETVREGDLRSLVEDFIETVGQDLAAQGLI